MTIFSSQGTALAYDETFGLTVKRAPCVSVTIITFLRNLFLWCVSVHMNVSVHMCVGAHVYVPHAYTGQIAASNVGLQEASILFSLELGLEWLWSKTKGCTFLCPHTLKIINTNHYTWLFCGNWVSNASLHFCIVKTLLTDPVSCQHFLNDFLTKDLRFSLYTRSCKICVLPPCSSQQSNALGLHVVKLSEKRKLIEKKAIWHKWQWWGIPESGFEMEKG